MQSYEYNSKDSSDNILEFVHFNNSEEMCNKKLKCENLKESNDELLNNHDAKSSKNLCANEDSNIPWLIYDSLTFIKWLQDRSLIKHGMCCNSCTKRMNWTKYSQTKDGFAWKCQMKNCVKYKSAVSIRRGSLFEKSNLTLKQWMHVVYLWSNNQSESYTKKLTNTSLCTLGIVYGICREVCSRHLLKNPTLLGGNGNIIQVVESCFLYKPKQQRGKELKQPISVFCLVDTSTQPVIGYMEIVETRKAKFLLPIIHRVVRPGSIVQTNDWRTYLNEISDSSELVNSITFAEPEKGTCLEVTMSYWEKQKNYIRKMKGCRKKYLHSYLQEFMWRDRYGLNAFDSICSHIAKEFPL